MLLFYLSNHYHRGILLHNVTADLHVNAHKDHATANQILKKSPTDVGNLSTLLDIIVKGLYQNNVYLQIKSQP